MADRDHVEYTPATLAGVVKVEISLISLRERNGMVVARANALAPAAGSEIWIKVEFERGECEPSEEAWDRALSVLDPA